MGLLAPLDPLNGTNGRFIGDNGDEVSGAYGGPYRHWRCSIGEYWIHFNETNGFTRWRHLFTNTTQSEAIIWNSMVSIVLQWCQWRFIDDLVIIATCAIVTI